MTMYFGGKNRSVAMNSSSKHAIRIMQTLYFLRTHIPMNESRVEVIGIFYALCNFSTCAAATAGLSFYL